MAGQLKAISNAAIGFLGLNTQESGVTLEAGYATKANNCIIDKYGRLGSRRGWATVTSPNANAVGTATFATNQMTIVPTVAGNFVVGYSYTITSLGTTTNAQWNTIAGTTNVTPTITYTVGMTFTAATVGTGSGQARSNSNFSIGDTVVATGVTSGTYITGNPSSNVYTLSTTPGTLSSRAVSTVSGLASTDYIESMFEFVTVGGISTILSAGGGKIFTGTTTLNRKLIYGNDSGGPVPLTTQPDYTNFNRWQWAALQENGGAYAKSYAVAVQRGKNALVYREGAHSGPFVLQEIGVHYSTNPANVATFDPDCCHAAFGRMWYGGLSENRLTVFYSGLLDPVDFSGADAGIIDISSKVGNNDEITAITSHNGYLIVFCKRNIVILSGAETPITDLAVADVIPGVGCIARDSVQQTGNDVIFLSASGVRALSRTVQEKSMPMRELSLNIRDDLIGNIQGENVNNIKSVYFERDAFYLLTLPATKQTICFDLRNILENGAARTTVWTAQGKAVNNDLYTPKAFCSALDKNLYFGMQGKIARYFGYSDNGVTYRMEYQTSNTDFGEPFSLKILKKAKIIVIGSGGQDLVFKYGFDYKTNFTGVTFNDGGASTVSEYGIAEYGIGEYSSGIVINEISLNIGGTGKILQFGIETDIIGAPVSIQQFSVYMKTGKTI